MILSIGLYLIDTIRGWHSILQKERKLKSHLSATFAPPNCKKLEFLVWNLPDNKSWGEIGDGAHEEIKRRLDFVDYESFCHKFCHRLGRDRVARGERREIPLEAGGEGLHCERNSSEFCCETKLSREFLSRVCVGLFVVHSMYSNFDLNTSQP